MREPSLAGHSTNGYGNDGVRGGESVFSSNRPDSVVGSRQTTGGSVGGENEFLNQARDIELTQEERQVSCWFEREDVDSKRGVN